MLRQVDFGLKIGVKTRMLTPLILLEAPRPFAMTHSPNRDLFLDQITTTLKQRGLHTWALTLLEAGQPLVFVGGQLLWLAQPAVGLFWSTERMRQLAQLMEDPAALHSLMRRLATDEVAV